MVPSWYDGLDDHMPPAFPVRRIAIEAGLLLGRIAGEIRGLKELSVPVVPFVFLSHAAPMPHGQPAQTLSTR
jgi:hypothetical protein